MASRGPRVIDHLVSWVLIHAIRPLPMYRNWRNGRVKIINGKNGGSALGRGLIRDHAVAEIFEFIAVCGQPVGSVGGPGSDADCWECKRVLRRAERARNARDGQR